MLQEKVAVITGSSRGIGRAIASVFAKNGAAVVVSGTKQEAIDATVADITAAGGRAVGQACDVTNLDACVALVERAASEFGKIDIMVNNAGVTRDKLLLKMDVADFDDILAINLRGVFNGCKAALSKMKRGGGRVINMTSVVGIMGNPGQANYAASKAGIIGLTRSLAKEYARRGVTVNAIAPGYIQTEMTGELNDKQRDAIIDHIPLKRLGETDDIANATLFLASDLAGYITGQVLQVDGGMIMA